MSVTGGQAESPAGAAAMPGTSAVMLVDQGDSASRLPILAAKDMLPEDRPQVIKHALAAPPPCRSALPFESTLMLSSAFENQRSLAAKSNVLQDDRMPDTAACSTMSLLGKRRRSAAVQVLAVALCPVHSTIPSAMQQVSSAMQQQQQQPQRQLQQQQCLPPKRQNMILPRYCFAQSPYSCARNALQSGSLCAAARAEESASRMGIPKEQSDQQLDGDDHVEQSCLLYSPKHDTAAEYTRTSDKNCRQQLERRLNKRECPPAPSKPASKPKKANLASQINKKFFVPSNLAELPPAFQALFA